jgi:glycolate oxidase iron-sulfur subunit
MVASEVAPAGPAAGPRPFDLDRCVHCGLCLNACPTYRELGLEMDSPRGRVHYMLLAAEGAIPIRGAYLEHLGLCLACRACETACPSGVPYGRLIEAARAQIEAKIRRRPWARLARWFLLDRLMTSPTLLRLAGNLLWLYQASGVQKVLRSRGLPGALGQLESLAPPAERPFFFRHIGRTFPAEGPRRYRVAFLAGCVANVCFARLNEATVRVLQKNGCEVVVPKGQTCCGALHVHLGLRRQARRLARRNIEVFLAGGYDAIITNAAGCGSTLKEYPELFEDDPAWRERAGRLAGLTRDITEFLASIELNRALGPLPVTVTYQDSCHLLHAQKIRSAPRQLLTAVPGLRFTEMPLADLCCGSAGVYNVAHREMAASILETKMECLDRTGAEVLATANPGCLLQLRAGVALHGRGQRVMHVVELLDEAYRNYTADEG